MWGRIDRALKGAVAIDCAPLTKQRKSASEGYWQTLAVSTVPSCGDLSHRSNRTHPPIEPKI